MLELSEAAFDRNVEKKDQVSLLAYQITRQASKVYYIDKAKAAVNGIKRLAALPGGRLKAMRLLVKIARAYCMEQEVQHQISTYIDDPHIISMDELMTDLIRIQYQKAKSSKQDWDPCRLIEKIELVQEDLPELVEEEDCDPEDEDKLFQKLLWLLKLVDSRRVAKLLADKVAGHRLPAELVEIVRDYTCCDGPLTRTSAQESGQAGFQRLERKLSIQEHLFPYAQSRLFRLTRPKTREEAKTD